MNIWIFAFLAISIFCSVLVCATVALSGRISKDEAVGIGDNE